MFEELGEFSGQLIIFFYGLTIILFIVKFINKNFKDQLMKNDRLNVWFDKLMKISYKSHKIFGYLTIAFILLHFYIQFQSRGLNITGSFAAATMLAQVGLGIYGTKFTKKRGKIWLWAHRVISILILVAILIHIE